MFISSVKSWAIAFALIGAICSASATTTSEIKYSYFDDYLSSLDEDQQAAFTRESRIIEGSGGEDEAEPPEVTRFTMPIRTGLKQSKDVTCCSLGQLAGDKGYHCFAKFYAARILLRNQNRAHNTKLGFHGRYSSPYYGTKLMRTFEQCVATRRIVFHKCCHLSAIDRRNKPHFDSIQRKRYEMKMKRIKLAKHLQVDHNFIGV
ncbi:uncharacterized protein LOC129221121 [Uloborus diversus]|uniref:uncharacterized protein LOC129221121 n=1 Tax=Uloborus diversus TaxID=327109 RepID=UPI00240A52DD|nr:uncharacterized protein LOC129221121 [Uloborus diversus]